MPHCEYLTPLYIHRIIAVICPHCEHLAIIHAIPHATLHTPNNCRDLPHCEHHAIIHVIPNTHYTSLVNCRDLPHCEHHAIIHVILSNPTKLLPPPDIKNIPSHIICIHHYHINIYTLKNIVLSLPYLLFILYLLLKIF